MDSAVILGWKRKISLFFLWVIHFKSAVGVNMKGFLMQESIQIMWKRGDGVTRIAYVEEIEGFDEASAIMTALGETLRGLKDKKLKLSDQNRGRVQASNYVDTIAELS